jgi:NADH:ubiquinone oxidoreductase subunit 3 (subunit A)
MELSGGLSELGLASFPAILAVSLGFTMMLYGLGKLTAPRTETSELKFDNYACGEEPATMGGSLEIRRLFRFALLFLAFDPIAFLISLAFIPADLAPLTLAVILLASIAVVNFAAEGGVWA